MRLKLGRPDLSRYNSLFDLPCRANGLTVTFLGVSTLLFDDGESAIMTDGFFSRPSLLKVGLSPLSSNHQQIQRAIRKLGFDHANGGRKLDGVIPLHSHFDHVMDSAAVATATGADLLGSPSVRNVALSRGFTGWIRAVSHGTVLKCGRYTITFLASEHSTPDRYPGMIHPSPRPLSHARDFKSGQSWSLFVTHESGSSALVQGSAGFVSGRLERCSTDVAYVSVAQLGLMSPDDIRAYWRQTVEAVRAREVVLIHWDDFFGPLPDVYDKMRALPFAIDDLNLTLEIFQELATEESIGIHLPKVWQPEDPWNVQPAPRIEVAGGTRE